MNVSQNSSSLSCYGKKYLHSRKGKLKVQPTAVSRRKFKTGRLCSLINHQQRNLSHNVTNNNISYKKEKSLLTRLLLQKQMRRLTNNENEVLSNSVFADLEQTFIQNI